MKKTQGESQLGTAKDFYKNSAVKIRDYAGKEPNPAQTQW